MQNPAPALRLVLPLGLAMIISFASCYYLPGVVAEPMAASTGATPGLLFTALSGAFFIAALCSLGAGRWTDRRGGREVLVAASLMMAGALGLMAVAQTPTMAVVAVLALGFGIGTGFYTPANALLVMAYGMGAKKPITAVSLIGACGGAIGWPVTLGLIHVLGWRGACGVWAAAHILICLPLYLALLPTGRGHESRALQDRVGWNRPMIQLALLFAGAWWVATACAAHMPRLLGQMGLGPAEAAMAASSMAVATIAMRGLALIAPPRANPLLGVRLATLLHPLGALLALLGGKAAAVAIPIGQGMGNGLLSVAAGVVPLHIFGKANYGQRQALMMLPARFAQALAPVSFGLALDQSPGVALCITSGLYLMMFGLSFGLKPEGGARRSKTTVAKAAKGA